MGFSPLGSAFILSLGFLGVSIYQFLEGNLTAGRFWLMVTTLAFFFTFFFFRALYYLRYRATFNDVSFVFFLPHVPLFFAFLSRLFRIEVDDLVILELLKPWELRLFANFVDLVSLPFYLFSLFLLLRTHLRYPFIRLTGHATDGLPSRLVALYMTVEVPFVYWIVALLFVPNLSLLLFGLSFLVIGFIGFFV
ncbi:MAG: hypothetical protein D6732_15840 [Methanobacteriota archaeon]|nr:MAG: hypothetical protein D6732_15840 [Euryarchaeota archaeon]